MTADPAEDPFLRIAFDAYLEVWAETGRFPPESERVRRRAYARYEASRANERKSTEAEPG
jgi:hypothetical protein